jgi:hypothetical protein
MGASWSITQTWPSPCLRRTSSVATVKNNSNTDQAELLCNHNDEQNHWNKHVWWIFKNSHSPLATISSAQKGKPWSTCLLLWNILENGKEDHFIIILTVIKFLRQVISIFWLIRLIIFGPKICWSPKSHDSIVWTMAFWDPSGKCTWSVWG